MISDKPSEAIRQALDDPAKCETDPRFVIDMNEWLSLSPNRTICSVCLAGAVLVQHHGITPDWRSMLTNKHRGLDQFRAGRIWSGIDVFQTPDRENNISPLLKEPARVEGLPQYVSVTDYDESPPQFRADLLTVADMLEGVGL